jgi:dTDP-4-amino-4,6-dideoxygalactose transaminase
MAMTDQLGDRVVSLPLWDEISEDAVARVVATVEEAALATRVPAAVSGA